MVNFGVESEVQMTNFRQGNAWKAAGVLVGLFGFLGVMALVPMAQMPTVHDGPEITLPTMQNVPVDGAFGIELE